MIRFLCLVLSFFLLAFGQPAWQPLFAPFASTIGFALFFYAVLGFDRKKRTIAALTFGFFVYLVQLSWFISHPYLYIIAVLVILSFISALPFAVLAFLMSKERLESRFALLYFAALWTLLEWSRLLILSGVSFNPIGLYLSTNLYSIQFAKIGGVYFLSFWVLMTNISALRLACYKTRFDAVCFPILVTLPYLYGAIEVSQHSEKITHAKRHINAVLLQTSFPIEEGVSFDGKEHFFSYILYEWRSILERLKPYKEKKIDLIALPEFVVPIDAFNPVFPYESVRTLFAEVFGQDVLEYLPEEDEPLGQKITTPHLQGVFVSNAFFLQAIANIFQAEIISGMEEVTYGMGKEHIFYSAALFVPPKETKAPFVYHRYAKQILVPMGEYIPFSFCKKLAESYGVFGSFTKGEGANVFYGQKAVFGPNICYEETFSDLIRENKVLGANVLVNVTNDSWYPDSKLPKQHFDHARLRAVENGIPLLRACNTGITCAVDPLGRVIDEVMDDEGAFEWLSRALFVRVPLYEIPTPYERLGDSFILGFCFLSLGAFFRKL